MHKPSDYAHRYGEPVTGHDIGASAVDAAWEPVPDALGESQGVPSGMELATFRLLYESEKICLFETRDGHLTAIDVNRLA